VKFAKNDRLLVARGDSFPPPPSYEVRKSRKESKEKKGEKIDKKGKNLDPR